jgi:hypothetical protein
MEEGMKRLREDCLPLEWMVERPISVRRTGLIVSTNPAAERFEKTIVIRARDETAQSVSVPR